MTSETLELTGYVQDLFFTSKNLGFLTLRTQGDLLNKPLEIQLVVKKQILLEYLKSVKNLKESYVIVSSNEKEDKKTKSGKDSWVLSKIQVLNETKTCPSATLGLKKEVSEVFKNLKARSLETYNLILARALLYQYTRKFFEERNFIEFSSPKLIQTYSESGADLFEILNSADGKKKFLAQSPQLYKQQLTNAGLSKVYQIGTIFRNQKFNTSRHMMETVCLDLEICNSDENKLIELLIEYIVQISKQLATKLGTESYTEEDFGIISYDEALRLTQSTEMTREAEIKIFDYLKKKFIIVKEYPSMVRPFYTQANTGFDILHQKCELASGSKRISELPILEENAKSKRCSLDSMRDYKKSFELGISSSVGCGLGLDRLLMVLLDKKTVQETQYF